MWSPFKTAATSIRYTVLIEAAPQSTVSRLVLADGSLFLSVGIGRKLSTRPNSRPFSASGFRPLCNPPPCAHYYINVYAPNVTLLLQTPRSH